LTKLDASKEEFTIDEIIEAMKEIDIDHYKVKIKDSFNYFDCTNGIDTETILRVLKRTHPVKESKLTEQIEKNKNELGRVDYESLLKILLSVF